MDAQTPTPGLENRPPTGNVRSYCRTPLGEMPQTLLVIGIPASGEAVKFRIWQQGRFTYHEVRIAYHPDKGFEAYCPTSPMRIGMHSKGSHVPDGACIFTVGTSQFLGLLQAQPSPSQVSPVTPWIFPPKSISSPGQFIDIREDTMPAKGVTMVKNTHKATVGLNICQGQETPPECLGTPAVELETDETSDAEVQSSPDLHEGPSPVLANDRHGTSDEAASLVTCYSPTEAGSEVANEIGNDRRAPELEPIQHDDEPRGQGVKRVGKEEHGEAEVYLT